MVHFLVSYLRQKLTGHYRSTLGTWPSDKPPPLHSTGEVTSATLDLVLEHLDQGGWWDTRKPTGEGCYHDKGPRQQDLCHKEREPGSLLWQRNRGI